MKDLIPRSAKSLFLAIIFAFAAIMPAHAFDGWVLPTNIDLYYGNETGFPIHVSIKETLPDHYLISIACVTGVIYYQTIDDSQTEYVDGEQTVFPIGKYFPTPMLVFCRDLDYMYIGNREYNTRISKSLYERYNELLRSDPNIRQVATNNAAEWANLQREIAASNSNAQSNNRQSTQSRNNSTRCTRCGDTGVNPQANSGGSLQKWVAYYNKDGVKCPYCHRYTAHYHDKCSSCNVPR